jgi:hypothetical protein
VVESTRSIRIMSRFWKGLLPQLQTIGGGRHGHYGSQGRDTRWCRRPTVVDGEEFRQFEHQRALARSTELILILTRITIDIDSGQSESSRSNSNSNNNKDRWLAALRVTEGAMIDAYAQFQRTLLRHRCKPAIAAVAPTTTTTTTTTTTLGQLVLHPYQPRIIAVPTPSNHNNNNNKTTTITRMRWQ